MAEYICREAIIDDLEAEIEAGNVALDEDVWVNKGLRIAIRDIKDIKAAEVQPVNQWISVKDRLPNEDDCYLVVIESEICVSIDIAEYSENRWHKHDKVLYWQPLPELPKDGDAE